MRVYEFGTEQEKTFAMFQCAAEPWWVFEASAMLALCHHIAFNSVFSLFAAF